MLTGFATAQSHTKYVSDKPTGDRQLLDPAANAVQDGSEQGWLLAAAEPGCYGRCGRFRRCHDAP